MIQTSPGLLQLASMSVICNNDSCASYGERSQTNIDIMDVKVEVAMPTAAHNLTQPDASITVNFLWKHLQALVRLTLPQLITGLLPFTHAT